MDRHWDENTKVLVYQVQIPLETNVLLKLNYPSLRNNTKMTTLPTLCNYGKTRIMVKFDLGGVYCTVCDKFRDCRFKLNSANTSLFYF